MLEGFGYLLKVAEGSSRWLEVRFLSFSSPSLLSLVPIIDVMLNAVDPRLRPASILTKLFVPCPTSQEF